MKVFSVCGITQSGKTTTIERIIGELCTRGYRVGAVKEIHFEAFAIDPSPDSNTHRHRKAGAGLVAARGYYETDLLFPQKLDMEKILRFYEGDYDYVVLEGVDDIPVPTIVAAHAQEDLQQKWSDFAFCVSGRICAQLSEYEGVPAISALTDIGPLVDLIEGKVYDRLPQFPAECCTACGMTCTQLGKALLRGEADRSQCVADQSVTLSVDGKSIAMVPFVQTILRNAVLGVAGELEGYVPGGEIKVHFRGERP